MAGIGGGAKARGAGAAPATLDTLVPRAAKAAPDQVALIGLDGASTWAEVEGRTRALAATLGELGVKPGDRVAIARRKTHESFEAVHGILRAGAVVAPIDPTAPPALARMILRDADAKAVIGDGNTLERLDPWSLGAVPPAVITNSSSPEDRPTVTWASATTECRDRPLPVIAPDDDAYIIYTSGSTGRPKGIVHTHASAMAYATRAVEQYRLTADDRVGGMNPLHFDMSTLELYAAPLAGATVVVMSEAHLQFPAALTERSVEHAVTVWYTVPFLLRGVADRGGLDRRPVPTLRAVLYGGEPYPGSSLRRLMNLLPGVEVINVYGPAEVNACTHHHVVDPESVGADVPIGRPWRGVDVRVMSGEAEVLPGTAGELWVSAPTAMREYAGLDQLTFERLHRREDGSPWYATGDLVVEDDEGVLWFKGRADHQVKVRGVRIELEAIENALTDAPGVLHAVAGPLGPSGDASHIAAAVVLASGVEVDEEQLRDWCVELLPSVAVPHTFSYRQSFPSTPSGKIDRRSVRAELASQDFNPSGGAS